MGKYQGDFKVEYHVLLAVIFEVEPAGSMSLAVNDSVKIDRSFPLCLLNFKPFIGTQ